MDNLGHRYLRNVAHSHKLRLVPGFAGSQLEVSFTRLFTFHDLSRALYSTWKKNFQKVLLSQNVCGNAGGKDKERHPLIFYLNTQTRGPFHCPSQQENIAAFHPSVGFLFLGPVFGKKMFCFSVQVVKI